MQEGSDPNAPLKEATEARQAERRGIWKILIASLVLAVLASFALVIFWANSVDAALKL